MDRSDRLGTGTDDAKSARIHSEIELADLTPDFDQSKGSIEIARCDFRNARSREEIPSVAAVTILSTVWTIESPVFNGCATTSLNISANTFSKQH